MSFAAPAVIETEDISKSQFGKYFPPSLSSQNISQTQYIYIYGLLKKLNAREKIHTKGV